MVFIDLTEYFRRVDMLGRCSMRNVFEIGLEFLKKKKETATQGTSVS